MAIYHLSVKIISRNKGRSSVGAAAYRSGDKIKNEYDGMLHDYSKKRGIVHSEIVLPKNAPMEFKDRGKLWNAVEKSEKRNDARTAREIEIALPNELTKDEQINLVHEYVKQKFVDIGMCADIAIHSGHKHKKEIEINGDEQNENITHDNPHAHILLTTRPVTSNGFSDKKNRDWDKRENVLEWRGSWAKFCNREFKKRNIDAKVDHRSFKEQGITDRLPTIHMGVASTHLEKKGVKTEKGNINREIKRVNAEIEKINADLQKHETELIRLEEQVQDTRRIAEDEKTDCVKEHPSAEASSDKTLSKTERIGKEMAELKNKYIRLELNKEKIANSHSYYTAEINRVQTAISDISKSVSTINNADKKIEELRQERSRKNIFQIKGKKDIDEKINGLENSKSIAIQLLKQYGITKDDTSSKIKELTDEKMALEQEKLKLTTVRAISEQQEKVGMEYKRHLIILELHPDENEIKAVEARYIDKDLMTDAKGEGTKIEIEKYKAIRKLESISPEEYIKIKLELPITIQKMIYQRDYQFKEFSLNQDTEDYEI